MGCHGLAGAYQHADVNIGWYPYRAKVASRVTSKPGGGAVLGELRALEGIALQSVRNPDCVDDPPRRPPVLGPDGHRYVWGYKRYGAKTGWIRLADVEADPDLATKPQCTGPAREDFEVGRGRATRGSRSGCGKKSVLKRVRAITARDVHLRYSPHGTGYHYLHHGDLVRVLLVKGPQGFVFVEVATAAVNGSARAGMRGWISASSLLQS